MMESKGKRRDQEEKKTMKNSRNNGNSEEDSVKQTFQEIQLEDGRQINEEIFDNEEAWGKLLEESPLDVN